MANGFMTTFGGDNTGFIRAVKGMEQATNKMGASIAGSIKGLVGAYIGVEAFKALIVGAAKAALAFDAFSDRQGTTLEETQRLSASFEKMGLTMGDAETALMKVTASRKDAVESNDAMVDSFAKLGITIEDLNNPMVTNADLLKKAGVALQTMKIDPSTTAALKELFGRSGPKMLNALKDLGEGNKIALMDDETIQRLDQAERSLERLKNTWYSIVARKWLGPLAEVGNAMFGPNSKTQVDKDMLYAADSAAAPGSGYDQRDQDEFHFAANYLRQSLAGEDKDALEFSRQKLSNLLEFKTNAGAMYTPKKDFIAEAIAIDGAEEKETNEKLFTDKRRTSEKIAAAQQELDEASRDALIEQMQPLQRQVAYRQQIVDLLEKADFIEAHMGENLESIALRKQALGLESKTKDDGGGGFSKPEKINIDDMAKNNLSLGIKAYEPMMNATRMNTAATVANTVELAKTGGFLSALQTMNSVDPWS